MKRQGAGKISNIQDDCWVVMASWGPSARDEVMEYTVRGVKVAPVYVDPYVDPQGRSYRWCVFPDYRVMLVNEGNILSRKRGKYDATGISKAAPPANRGDKRPAGKGTVLGLNDAGSDGDRRDKAAA